MDTNNVNNISQLIEAASRLPDPKTPWPDVRGLCAAVRDRAAAQRGATSRVRGEPAPPGDTQAYIGWLLADALLRHSRADPGDVPIPWLRSVHERTQEYLDFLQRNVNHPDLIELIEADINHLIRREYVGFVKRTLREVESEL